MTIEQTVLRIADALKAVACLDAVVLGGSRASGHASAHSDIDIGVYYAGVQPLDLVQLNQVAQALDDMHRADLVTAPGGWGPWVNAGAWMSVDGLPVDLILRDTTRVSREIAACEVGIIEAHYQPGHPHAYINMMYMGELAVSRLLWDATSIITPLKQRAEQYSDVMQHAVYARFAFEARFSADLAHKTIERNDSYYIVAHVVRAISAMNQVIFARNRHYCLNEKHAVARASMFAHTPVRYRDRVDEIVRSVGTDPISACNELHRLVEETVQLINTTPS